MKLLKKVQIKKPKKYNETITEIYNCENVKEMDEIDF